MRLNPGQLGHFNYIFKLHSRHCDVHNVYVVSILSMHRTRGQHMHARSFRAGTALTLLLTENCFDVL